MNEFALIDLKGIVIAAEWGPDGDVSAVDLAGYDEKRYRIANDPRGHQLHRLVKQSVVIHGRLSSENKQNIIHVEHYSLDSEDSVTTGFE